MDKSERPRSQAMSVELEPARVGGGEVVGYHAPGAYLAKTRDRSATKLLARGQDPRWPSTGDPHSGPIRRRASGIRPYRPGTMSVTVKVSRRTPTFESP